MSTLQLVHDAIKNGILNGEYPSGTFIREEAIAKQLAVSRTPVREAINRLVSGGWLEAIPNRGARVTQWAEADVEEVFELRVLLEPLAAKCAASRLTGSQLEELDQLQQAMSELAVKKTSAARDKITGLNHRLHAIIAEAADLPRVRRVLQDVVVMPVARRSFHNYNPAELQRSMNHHRELIEALRSRDGEWAAAVMRAHMLAARAVHLRHAAKSTRLDSQKTEGLADADA
jgi:DNA-binding GntR family transcriptional regulator